MRPDERVRRAGRSGGGSGHTPEVRLAGITRAFGDAVANDRVDLCLRPGTIHALVGENGAGKSTLMRILYGLLQPDAGRIQVDGRDRPMTSPAVALASGIGMIHQHFMLVPVMTVLENIVLGTPGARSLRPLPRGGRARELEALFARYGFELAPHERIDRLGVGGRQRVEIARLLYRGARVLICDEPTAVLAPPEVRAFLDILRRFRAEGRSVVLVTHKLSEVLEVADEVTVLRHGRVVGAARRGEFDRDRLVQWIMGEAQATVRGSLGAEAPAVASAQAPLLEARGLSLRDAEGRLLLDRVDLTVGPGEIVGVAGVAGNGQSELAEILSGRAPATAGELVLEGCAYGPGRPVPAAARPALIAEDRTQQGLIAAFRLWENLLLGCTGELSWMRAGWYGHGAARAWARPLLERYGVRPPAPDLRAAALSGGNQQKLLCAREMSRGRRLLIACQPTRGIDLTSTAFLHGRLRDYAAGGAGVVLISTDLEEVLALAGRTAVIYRGRLGPAHARGRADRERIGREMVGLAGGERADAKVDADA